jgi:hypothetical protein
MLNWIERIYYARCRVRLPIRELRNYNSVKREEEQTKDKQVAFDSSA